MKPDILHSVGSYLLFYSLYDVYLAFILKNIFLDFFFCFFRYCCEVVTFIFISFLGLVKLQGKRFSSMC